MTLLYNLNDELKSAMRAKDSIKLEALRAIKSAVLLAKTAGAGHTDLSENDEIKILQKLVKQRKDSATIYREQNRGDLAATEEAQADVIAEFLPEQLSAAAIERIVDEIIGKTGAEGMKDMGKVMGMASKEMAGKADGKTISIIVKHRLNG
ncbi:MAG: glutamyl-tRNA amidotransferase [Flavobacteriaceae bacterium TMED171]|nr:glutamyl-tRNA amidotransferase [Flavobacteriaceae bacterium]OUW33544.1 MAG: glutamyl-tRNA amidotransferase [Flavobacteriaceae bacterium TMED171]|tara:strand:+ start:219 stop:671 length:453 start_codon:yes stop_codon:yes gene_type:complete